MERRRRRATLIGSVALLAVTVGCTADGDATATPAEPSTVSAAPPATGLPQVVARLQPSVVTVRTDQGLGSGVVFRDGGLVLTNEHVVGDQRDVELALADGTRVPARVVAADAVTDLAVLRAERTDLPPAPLRTELPAPGEPVVALGSPLGFLNSVTAGIVSGVGREIPGSASQGNALVDLIPTSTPDRPPGSGSLSPGGPTVGSRQPARVDLPPLGFLRFDEQSGRSFTLLGLDRSLRSGQNATVTFDFGTGRRITGPAPVAASLTPIAPPPAVVEREEAGIHEGG
ncbi:S1C family serine protease [Micromonospora marina]|uniref:S1C family serine protease n=1 Tax=Micromonospora marina TaxID=307120 RepID=UPI003452A3F9